MFINYEDLLKFIETLDGQQLQQPVLIHDENSEYLSAITNTILDENDIPVLTCDHYILIEQDQE